MLLPCVGIEICKFKFEFSSIEKFERVLLRNLDNSCELAFNVCGFVFSCSILLVWSMLNRSPCLGTTGSLFSKFNWLGSIFDVFWGFVNIFSSR